MTNFVSFCYFQTSLLLRVEQGLKKLPKCDIDDLKLLFHCYILIPRKCPRKTPFKTHSALPYHLYLFSLIVGNLAFKLKVKNYYVMPCLKAFNAWNCSSLFIMVSDHLFSVSELSTTESWCQEGWAKTFDLSFDKVDDTVERIHVKDVSLEDFIELYEKPYKPVS